jgi:hypothetical protein
MYETFYKSYLLLRAANPPIETWSSWLAEVEIESTEAGFTKHFDYESKAAEVS